MASRKKSYDPDQTEGAKIAKENRREMNDFSDEAGRIPVLELTDESRTAISSRVENESFQFVVEQRVGGIDG
jgi:hypothetical protein